MFRRQHAEAGPHVPIVEIIQSQLPVQFNQRQPHLSQVLNPALAQLHKEFIFGDVQPVLCRSRGSDISIVEDSAFPQKVTINLIFYEVGPMLQRVCPQTSCQDFVASNERREAGLRLAAPTATSLATCF